MAAERLAAEGLPVEGVACDDTDGAAVQAMVNEVWRRHGRIDVVLANAGAALDAGPLLGSRDEQLDGMMDLQVRGVIRLANASLPLMARGGGGAFVIMSSIAGLRGNRGLGLYGITKAANAQLAGTLAVQWRTEHIRVNALSPGVIDTGFARPITGDPEVAAARLATTPLGRFGEPKHVAGAVLWLASEAGAFVTGQNTVIDGGTLISD